MTEPSSSEPAREAVSRATVKASVDMGVPLRVAVRNERRRRRRRRLGAMARGVGTSFGFIVRFVLGGGDGDDD